MNFFVALALTTSRSLSQIIGKSLAFVGRVGSGPVSRGNSVGKASQHAVGCACGSCVNVHSASCGCAGCRSATALFADVAEGVSAEDVPVSAEDVPVPAEVEAMDGVESTEEAHNVDRPARSALKKKRGPKGKDLSEFEAGSTVKGSVRTITSYGAFIDIGASTDGLLHISQLSSEYVGDVNEVLKAGQEVDVRIVSIDSEKGQVALSLLTQDEADASQSAQRQQRDRPQRQSRRDDSKVLAGLDAKGWDSDTFVEGTVVSVVDFGCFVRVDASKLNSECEGELDGLVHISAMAAGRVNSASEMVSPDQKVQVRMKAINGNKVSLTMVSVEDEESKSDSNAPIGGGEGAKDWKESLEKFDATMPVFKNGPIVVGALD